MEYLGRLVSSGFSTVTSNKLASTGTVVGVYYMYRRYMQYYEQEMHKFGVKQKYFKESQQTSDKTVEGFLPQIEEIIEALSSVNMILSQLQNNLTSPTKLKPIEKKQLWTQLKNQVFIKATTTIYCICYEILVVRLLVNILGKYLYQDSIQTEHPGGQIFFLSPKVQREFLTLSRYLISQGFQNFYETISQAVKNIVEEISIEKSYTLSCIVNIFTRIENETTSIIKQKTLLHFLFPPNFEAELENKVEIAKKEKKHSERKMDFPSSMFNGDFNEIDVEQFLFENQFDEDFDNSGVLKEPLKQKLLVNELINIIDSPEFFDISRFMIKRSFSSLVSNLGDFMKTNGSKIKPEEEDHNKNMNNTNDNSRDNQSEREQEVSNQNLSSNFNYSISMIKLIPQISNQAKYDMRGGSAINHLFNRLTSMEEVAEFSEFVFDL